MGHEAQLCLPPPFGLGQKAVHLSMRAPNDRHREVAVLAVENGCPGHIAEKVMACIKHSGRYDCLAYDRLRVEYLDASLRALGGELVWEHMDFDWAYGITRSANHPSHTRAASYADHSAALQRVYDGVERNKREELYRGYGGGDVRLHGTVTGRFSGGHLSVAEHVYATDLSAFELAVDFSALERRILRHHAASSSTELDPPQEKKPRPHDHLVRRATRERYKLEGLRFL